MAEVGNRLAYSALVLGNTAEDPELADGLEGWAGFYGLLVAGQVGNRMMNQVELFREQMRDKPGSPLIDCVSRDLVDFCMGELQKYLKEKEVIGDFAEHLSVAEKSCLAVLFLKDGGETAKNSIDLYVWALKSIETLSPLKSLSDDKKRALLRACLLHDIGKINLPTLVLENPIPRVLQGLIYAKYLEACGEKVPKDGVNGDCRGLIPTHALVSGSFEMLDSYNCENDFRAQLELVFKNNKSVLKAMIEKLSGQRGIPNRLSEFGISPEETFMWTLDRHEAVSLVLIMDAAASGDNFGDSRLVSHIVSRHHDNEVSRQMRETAEIALTEAVLDEDQILFYAIRIFDVVSALRQKRSYKNAMSDAMIVQILRKMCLEKPRFFDRNLVEAFIDAFLSPSVLEEDREGREGEA